MVEFTPHEAAAREALSLPVQLPSKLIGREVVLAQVYSQLKDNKPVLIYGAPGIGKTAVAATLASAYTEMPGGVLWLHTREDETFADLLARVGRAYKESAVANSENPLGMVGAVSTVLTQHKPLIVLDGRINPGAAAEFIGKCAQDLPVLLVTEEKIEGPWGAIGLEKLDHDQAATLMMKATRASASWWRGWMPTHLRSRWPPALCAPTSRARPIFWRRCRPPRRPV
jgi:energy-coupling factor transporter ATP-binding protein EcfA2